MEHNRYIFPRPYYILQVENLTFVPLMQHIKDFTYEIISHWWIAPNGEHMSTEQIYEFAQRNKAGFKHLEYIPNVRK